MRKDVRIITYRQLQGKRAVYAVIGYGIYKVIEALA